LPCSFHIIADLDNITQVYVEKPLNFEVFMKKSHSELMEFYISNELKDADLIEIIFTPITNFIEFNVFLATNNRLVNSKTSEQIGTEMWENS